MAVLLLVIATLAAACGGDDATTTAPLPNRSDGQPVGPERAPGTDPTTTVAPAETITTTAGAVESPPQSSSSTVTSQAPPTSTTAVPPSSTTTSTTSGSTATTTPPPSTTAPPDGPFILVGDDRYQLTPTTCDVWDEYEVLINGTAVSPDGTTVFFAIEMTEQDFGGAIIDLDSYDPLKRSENTLEAGYGVTPDDHFESNVTGRQVEIDTTFVPSMPGDPMPGRIEVECPSPRS